MKKRDPILLGVGDEDLEGAVEGVDFDGAGGFDDVAVYLSGDLAVAFDVKLLAPKMDNTRFFRVGIGTVGHHLFERFYKMEGIAYRHNR